MHQYFFFSLQFVLQFLSTVFVRKCFPIPKSQRQSFIFLKTFILFLRTQLRNSLLFLGFLSTPVIFCALSENTEKWKSVEFQTEVTWESLLVGLNCADLYVAKVICFGDFLRLILPRWDFNYVTGHTVFWIWWVTRAYGSFVYRWFIVSLSPWKRPVVAWSNIRHCPMLWPLAGWNSFRDALLKLPL